MTTRLPLSDTQWRIVKTWLPALIAGGLAWLAFVIIGNTPLLRSTGLALVIVGMTLALRWLGWLLAITGGLALAFSPAFWQQTGGLVAAYTPATIVLALGAAALVGALAVMLSQRPYVVLVVALMIFGVIFASQIGVPRSLRLTVLASAWLIYLLTLIVLVTNPRPDDPPPYRLNAQFRAALLLILALGVVNDPLVVLFVPAVGLGLSQTKSFIPRWYWWLIGGVLALGSYGILTQYYHPEIWQLPAQLAARIPSGQNIPYLIAVGWRDPVRWVQIVSLIAEQFTWLGVLFGVFGVARLARWYPVLGMVTMIAYATFFTFGLAYYGTDRTTLLLPLMMIQVLWITYAVYAFGQWLEKSAIRGNFSTRGRQVLRWVAPTFYLGLPALLLLNIAG